MIKIILSLTIGYIIGYIRGFAVTQQDVSVNLDLPNIDDLCDQCFGSGKILIKSGINPLYRRCKECDGSGLKREKFSDNIKATFGLE